ncbi:MAG: hypothetical protein K5888_09745 [Lachnospiraceae bacterium]|nr:hypothetical protein [Lachnospiraceae bacterium]
MDKEKIRKLFDDNMWCFILHGAATLILLVGLFLILKSPKVDIQVTNDMITFYEESNQYDAYVQYDFPKGIYNISLSYESADDVTAEVIPHVLGSKSVKADSPFLSRNAREADFNIWLNDKCDLIIVRLRGGEGPLLINDLRFSTADNSKLNLVFRALLIYLVFCLIILGFIKRKVIFDNSFVILGITFIVLISSMGIFARFITIGHDLNFHLMRIEGLKEALLIGDIPVKIQSNWCYGYGYAVSTMYGDITLLLPAVMRILGFSIQDSYKTFVLAVNLATALTAFLCFDSMSNKKKEVALLASFLYTCAPYRLCCIYIRGAFGEFSGMMFIPLVIYGFYKVYSDETDEKEFGKAVCIAALGFSGIIQTHILTCIMISIFLGIFMIVKWKKTISKRVLYNLLQIGGFTVLLNLWFVIPLLRLMKEPLRLHTENGYSADFQLYGLSLAEVFAQHSSGSASYNWAYLSSLNARMSMPVGNGFVVLVAIYLYLYAKNKLSDRKGTAMLVMGLGFLSTFMATNLFPYDFIERVLPLASKFITRVNVCYRYITMSIVIFSVFTVFFFTTAKKKYLKKYSMIILIVVALVNADQVLDYVYKVLYNAPAKVVYDDIGLNTTDLIGYEYLYEGTDCNRTETDRDITGSNVIYTDVIRNANRFDIAISAVGEGGYLDLPLFYYPGYEAKADTGASVRIERGDNNNRLRVIPEGGFSGNITVRYREPALWRICEIISLLSFAALIVYTKWYTQIRSRFLKAVTKK